MATKYGTTGNDTITAGSGGDTLVGYDGNDSLVGGMSADWLLGNQGSDTLAGGDGNDTLSGGMGDDFIGGQMGADIIYGNEGADVISGGMGNDTIIGGKGSDTLYGNEGDDLFYANEDSDRVIGGDGIDTAAFADDQNRYSFSRASNGDLLVTDLTGDGGTDDLSEVEFLMFGNGQTIATSDLGYPPAPPTPPFTPNNDFTFNGRLPATDTKLNGDFLSGNGTPGDHFEGITNRDNHVHIFKSETYRTAYPPLQPVAVTNDGVTITNDYRYAAGTQSTANGSSSDRADRAATVDNFDIGTDDGTTIAQFLAGGGRIERSYDRDPTTAVDAYTLEARLDPNGVGVDWYVKGTNTPGQTDDAGDANTSANSFSRSFVPGFSNALLLSGAQFTDTFSAYDSAGRLVASIVDHETLT